jgi:drug/metabolite transporter (DMT)-like permease
VTFARLRPADWVVLVAALGLLLATGADWYSTESGEEARTIEDSAPQPDIRERAALLAENEERTAWQPVGFADLIVLIGLLATAALSVVAAYARAAGRRPERLGPTALAGLAATLTALLVLYRILQEPGFDALTTVQLGAPLALALLGAIACAAAVSVRQEEGARAADLQSRR